MASASLSSVDGFFQIVEFIYRNTFVIHGTSPQLLYVFEIKYLNGSTILDSIELLHTIEASYYHRSDITLSPSGMSESRLVMLGVSREVKGLVISHNKVIPPAIVQLGRCSNDWDIKNCCALGISASLFFDHARKTYGIVTQEWNVALPDQPTPLPLPSHRVALRFPRGLAAFDESTGRLVFLNNGWNHALLVVDLV